jgi:fatty-acyl-CoA synthase
VTVTAGVPTHYANLLRHYEAAGLVPRTLRRILVAGSAPAPNLIEGFERLGVVVNHVWGMTETSPSGTSAQPSRRAATLPAEGQRDRKMSQGQPIYGIDIKIADTDGGEMPRDGRSAGRFMVRGPWVISGYFRNDRDVLQDGWFDTGDLAVMDEDNNLRLTDRAKDVIKSGGEWISSIDIENLVAGCPGVSEAAVVGIPHPKWEERPLLVVVQKPGVDLSVTAIKAYLEGRIAKWWIPDDVVFTEALSYGATGKIQKMQLRQRFAGHYAASAQTGVDT